MGRFHCNGSDAQVQLRADVLADCAGGKTPTQVRASRAICRHPGQLDLTQFSNHLAHEWHCEERASQSKEHEACLRFINGCINPDAATNPEEQEEGDDNKWRAARHGNGGENALCQHFCFQLDWLERTLLTLCRHF